MSSLRQGLSAAGPAGAAGGGPNSPPASRTPLPSDARARSAPPARSTRISRAGGAVRRHRGGCRPSRPSLALAVRRQRTAGHARDQQQDDGDGRQARAHVGVEAVHERALVVDGLDGLGLLRRPVLAARAPRPPCAGRGGRGADRGGRPAGALDAPGGSGDGGGRAHSSLDAGGRGGEGDAPGDQVVVGGDHPVDELVVAPRAPASGQEDADGLVVVLEPRLARVDTLAAGAYTASGSPSRVAGGVERDAHVVRQLVEGLAVRRVRRLEPGVSPAGRRAGRRGRVRLRQVPATAAGGHGQGGEAGSGPHASGSGRHDPWPGYQDERLAIGRRPQVTLSACMSPPDRPGSPTDRKAAQPRCGNRRAARTGGTRP